jgi:hypothetical protein
MITKIKITDGRQYNKGRPPMQEPSNRDQHILEALREGHSLAEVGRVYDLSRQRILQIKLRWPELAPRLRPVLNKKSTDFKLKTTANKWRKHNGTNTTLRS